MKLVCIGDSFTRGFGVKQNENWISNLNIKNLTIINKGINGDTTSGMLARFNSDVISLSPNYVLIMGGANDFIVGSSCEIPKNNYMALVHQTYHHGIIPIIGIEPRFSPELLRSDWANFSDFKEVCKKQIELRDYLLKMCHTFGVFYIDFYDSFNTLSKDIKDEDLYIDGIHLTPRGHEIISKIAENSLRRISIV